MPEFAPLGSGEFGGMYAPATNVDRQGDDRATQTLRDSLNTIEFGPIVGSKVESASVQAASGRRRSVMRQVLGGAIGAAGGFFAGAYLGAAIEGDRCHCDDPGLKGALIGVPIGAVTGGILGAIFF